MTPQEQQMIDDLIGRIRNTRITDRDPEAAAHLQQELGGDPDAIYILAQTVLVQQQALLQAQAQLRDADAEIVRLRDAAGHPPQQGPKSWLDRFFGSSVPTQNQDYPGQPVYGAPGYATQPPYDAPVYGGAPPAYPQQPYPLQAYGYGGPAAYGQPTGGSFLRNAAQTAAGVAAGALIFEGVESMFGGHSGFGGGGFGHEGGTTINNYYEDLPHPEHHAATDADGSFYDPSHDASRNPNNSSTSNNGLSPDIEDRRDFADGGNNNDATSDDTDDADNDSFTDDGNSFNDGGSFDDGGSSSDDGSY